MCHWDFSDSSGTGKIAAPFFMTAVSRQIYWNILSLNPLNKHPWAFNFSQESAIFLFR